MAVEMLVGLFVTDDVLYQQYREKMMPILKTYEGGFGYDFKVAEVLKGEVDTPINRVFTIYFENNEAMDNFFADKNYLDVRNKYYEPSVSAKTIISKYEK